MSFLKRLEAITKGDLPPGFHLEVEEDPPGIAHDDFEDYEYELPAEALKDRFDILVYTNEDEALIAEARFLPTPDGKGVFSAYTEVEGKYRRLGIATAIYVYVEKVMKRKIFPSPKQDQDGKLFWTQNARPFGSK